ncbi:hypothetical protein [Amphritea balenae]|uniref:Uncharacterized protein n=1 Tax=Amphritea balenae TaxID=452629 RepID=A0A3P1SS28_9GAMM|nr:hypothetical protein [Amphritea balenae]RRC99947.1 hypothetical protein EHS89_06940 [Amphritea balenae]GGK75331.1 hypothetical protein GCM10007941_26790 [Amphritea balenae]
MQPFNPVTDIENSQLILEQDEWPNFHDAEVHNLNIWRGDVRPEEDIWIGPLLELELELCALQLPYMVILRFHDCEGISLEDFNHQNALYDLNFSYEERGKLRTGEPMTPYIRVRFEQAFGAALQFRCFKVEVISRQEPDAYTPAEAD